MINKEDFYGTNTIKGRKLMVEKALNATLRRNKEKPLNKLFGLDDLEKLKKGSSKSLSDTITARFSKALKSRARSIIFPFSIFKDPLKLKNYNKAKHLINSALLNTRLKKGKEKSLKVGLSNYMPVFIGVGLVLGLCGFVAASVLTLGIAPAIVGSALAIYGTYATGRAARKVKFLRNIGKISSRDVNATNRNEHLLIKLYKISESLSDIKKNIVKQPKETKDFNEKITKDLRAVVNETSGEIKPILNELVESALAGIIDSPDYSSRITLLFNLIKNIENIDVSKIPENSVRTILQQNNPTQNNPIVSEQVTSQVAIGRQSIASEGSSYAAMSTGESSSTLYNPSTIGGHSPRSESSNEDFSPSRLELADLLYDSQEIPEISKPSSTGQEPDNSGGEIIRVHKSALSALVDEYPDRESQQSDVSDSSTLNDTEFDKKWGDEQQGAPTVLKRGKEEQKDLTALTGQNNKDNTLAPSPRKLLEQSKRKMAKLGISSGRS